MRRTLPGRPFYALPILALVVGASVLAAVSYQSRYSVPWDQPSAQALRQLQWVSQEYGYNNKSVILVVDGFNNYLWALGLTGLPIYYGHLTYLLANTTEYSLLNSQSESNRTAYIGAMQVLWVDGIVPNFQPNKYTILITANTYNFGPEDRAILQRVGPGVYEVKKMSSSVLSEWLANSTITG